SPNGKYAFDISGGYDDEFWDIEPISDPYGVKDDGFVAVGSTYNTSTGQDIVIMRLTSSMAPYTGGSWGTNGRIIVNGPSEDVAYGVEEIQEGSTNYLLICGTFSSDKFNPGGAANNNVWVGKLKLDGTWATGWNTNTYPGKEYGYTGHDLA